LTKKRNKTIEIFEKINKESNNDYCLKITEKKRTMSGKKIRQLVLKRYNIESASLQNASSQMPIEVLKYLKKLKGNSFRQYSN